MADYWGLDAIARALGVRSRNTVYALFTRYGPFMFRSRRPGHIGRTWYSNDRLLAAYEISRAQRDREAYLLHQAQRQAGLRRESAS